MKIRVSELTGAALDWAVAVCEGKKDIRIFSRNRPTDRGWVEVRYNPEPRASTARYDPSEDWFIGGPIIERVGITVRQIWRGTHALYGYNERDLKRWPNAEIVARQTAFGPSRWIKVPIPPQPSDGKWMAQLCRSSSSSVDWSIKRDFLSDTPLVAAMRCYVDSKMGDEVDVPEELL